MNSLSSSELTEKIVEKAKSLGASIAGVASVESLKEMNLIIESSIAGDVSWPARWGIKVMG